MLQRANSETEVRLGNVTFLVKLDSFTHCLSERQILGWHLFGFHLMMGLDSGDQLIHLNGEDPGEFGELLSMVVISRASRVGGVGTIIPLGSGAG